MGYIVDARQHEGRRRENVEMHNDRRKRERCVCTKEEEEEGDGMSEERREDIIPSSLSMSLDSLSEFSLSLWEDNRKRRT